MSAGIRTPSLGQDQQRDLRGAGSLSASATSYATSSESNRRDPFTWLLTGNASLSYKSLSIPITLVVSEQETSVRQAFNQFGFSPSLSWFKAHVGYRNVSFSPYTLGGATFLGGGFEADPGLLRLGAVYGQFNRAIEIDATDSDVTPSYSRIGYSAKLGLGTETSFVDLILFRAEDDTSSVDRPLDDLDILPHENLVGALVTKITVGRAFSLDAELAVSGFNRDRRAGERETADIPELVDRFFTPRIGSEGGSAIRAAINVNTRNVMLRAQYARVSPFFQTLGAYYFANDIERITISPTFRAMRGRFRLSLSGGTQRNNLDQAQSIDTRRLIGSANLSWTPARVFQISARFANFSSSLKSAEGVRADTIDFRNVNRNMSVSPRLTFRSTDISHTFTTAVAFQDYEQRSARGGSEKTTSELLSLSGDYSLTFNKTGLSFQLASRYSKNDTGVSETSRWGIDASIGFRAFSRMLSGRISFGLASRSVAGLESERQITSRGSLSFRPSRSDTFSVRANYGSNPVNGHEENRLNELLTTFSYSRRFST